MARTATISIWGPTDRSGRTGEAQLDWVAVAEEVVIHPSMRLDVALSIWLDDEAAAAEFGERESLDHGRYRMTVTGEITPGIAEYFPMSPMLERSAA